MKRSPIRRRPKVSRDANELARLAIGLASSGSRAEDSYWEKHMNAVIGRVLSAGEDETLEAALDRLYDDDPRAYDELADVIEARTESPPREGFNMVLMAAPLLAWSRAAIPAGSISAEVLANLRVQLQAHVLGKNTQLALADVLFSPDQLPQGYSKTLKLAEQLAEAAGHGRNLHVEAKRLPKSGEFLADARYLLAAIAVPSTEALFRWQEEGTTREGALAQWRTQGTSCLAPLLQGCAYELLLPDAYYAAGRKAEREARPFSLRAAITLIESGLSAKPETIRAVIAPFYDERLEEYRVAFSVDGKVDSVVYGVVWPLLGAEDEHTECVAEIEALLRERGVSGLTTLDERLPLEYCDDCGAPLFANGEGEPVHAEWPEDTPAHAHLH